MTTKILESLNKEQYQAVTTDNQNLLVLAGAGSGKTRVLAHRIAWLLENNFISQNAFLAVTFTNKAASEMRTRIETLIQAPISNLCVGTFHGLAHRFLRKHWHAVNLPETFQIIDSEDQFRLLRRIMSQELQIDEDKLPVKKAQWFINAQKDEGTRPQYVKTPNIPDQQLMLNIYKHYQAMCDKNGLVDFAELLLRAHELWLNHPEILAHYQERFKHILVDEFQDTNTIQYAWIRLLAGKNNAVTIVGDDDQSIYGWRGAKIENIHRFQKDFPDVKTIRLEQNYRSTNNILNAANILIANNAERLGKNLWTEKNEGELITCYRAFSDMDEARFIGAQIFDHVNLGNRYDECAILYRSNAQSRILEETLLQMNIPYRIYGGLRFFERAEIKDALAYLNLILNRQNNAAFERIVNVPARGIGHRTLDLVREMARTKNISLWDATQLVITENLLPARASHALMNFTNLIESSFQAIQDLPLAEQTDHVLNTSGLIDHYKALKGEKARMKADNLEELISAAKYFEEHYEISDDDVSLLSEFLSHASLESGEMQKTNDSNNCVQLMTLHAAKGLEFPVVFMPGLEQNLFPHYARLNNSSELEEERRLCYVGITRAMKKLFMSHAQSRQIHGKTMSQYQSMFLKEIPKEYLHEIDGGVKIDISTRYKKTFDYSPSKTSVKKDTNVTDTSYKIGQRVKHTKFGEGIIMNFEGAGENAVVQIHFKKVGKKNLALAYAKLEILN